MRSAGFGYIVPMPVILQPDSAAIAQCAERLRRGHAVAFPTETVYGLACDSTSEAAVAEVYRLKQRPSSNPLIAHVLDAAMAKRTGSTLIGSSPSKFGRSSAAMADRSGFVPVPATIAM